MTPEQRKAMEQALEALENLLYWDNGKPEYDEAREAITAVRQALEQQPCKYGNEPYSCTSDPMNCQCALDAALEQCPHGVDDGGCKECYEQQPAAPAIPEGWKLVPVEPTKEMLDKGRIDNSIHGRTLAEACYRSMLNAAPSKPS